MRVFSAPSIQKCPYSSVTKPAVLLMDEPFGAVDALTRERLRDHLLKLWQADRPTLILVTPDVDEALALGDRVVVMRGHGHGIERIVEVPFERPRRRTTESFQRLKKTVTGTLHAAMSYVPPPRSPALQLVASRNVA